MFPVFSANIFPHAARAELCFHKPLIDFENWSTLRKEVWFYCCTNCCRLIYNILFNSGVFTRYFLHSSIFGLCWRSSSAVLAYNFDKYARYLELNDKNDDSWLHWVLHDSQASVHALSLRTISTCLSGCITPDWIRLRLTKGPADVGEVS